MTQTSFHNPPEKCTAREPSRYRKLNQSNQKLTEQILDYDLRLWEDNAMWAQEEGHLALCAYHPPTLVFLHADAVHQVTLAAQHAAMCMMWDSQTDKCMCSLGADNWLQPTPPSPHLTNVVSQSSAQANSGSVTPTDLWVECHVGLALQPPKLSGAAKHTNGRAHHAPHMQCRCTFLLSSDLSQHTVATSQRIVATAQI